jgi:hypothetical protein
MARAATMQTNLNAGELSPMLEGRIDVGKYGVGLKKCENFLPTVQGPITARAGTRYVSEVKDSADRTWLVPFVFSATDGWILEFGDGYIRFYTNRGQVLSGPSAYEIVSPYALADLTASDGSFALTYVQSADVVYLAHPYYAVRKLSRTNTTSWTLATVDFAPPPFQDINTTQANTVYASASTGTGVTLTASVATFTADMVGEYFYLEGAPSVAYTPWEAGKAVALNDYRRSDGNIYQATNAATTAGIKPTHTEGSRSDGAVTWAYRHSGYGWVQITGYTSATAATCTVIKELPSSCVGSGNATYKWAKAAWNVRDGYPTHVTFFRERLTFARGNRLWMSVSGDYENFSSKDGDTVTADMAVDVQLVSNKVNNTTWLAASSGLIVGTTGTEFLLNEMSSGDPFGPDNVKASPQGNYGSRGVQGLRIGESVLFIQRAGRKVREIKYSFEADAYVSTDVTVLADHITQGGIVSWDYAQEPDSVVWAARTDGTLLGFTFNREQDVIGWSRHTIGGDGIVECVCSIPSPDAGRDDVWMIVRRTIDGVTKRYVEYMTERYEEGDDVADLLYMDAGATYSGASALTISGLGYLEGMTVGVLANGAAHPDCVVSGGSITLQRAVTKAQIGLRYSPVMETMRIEGGAQNGAAQGKTKRISQVTIRFLNTLNALAGPAEDKLDRVTFRRGSDLMGSAPPLFTGDKRLPWPSGYETEGRMVIKQDQPLPITVVAIMPVVNTMD